MEQFIYMVAISFQLAGALLLLVNSSSTKRSNLVKGFAKGKMIFRDGNTKKLFYSKEAFVAICQNAYLNKSAFLYISIGYFLGVFGEIDSKDKFVVALCVIILAAVEIAMAYILSKQICKHSENIKKEITNDELLILGLEPDAESISTQRIDEIVEEVSEGK